MNLPTLDGVAASLVRASLAGGLFALVVGVLLALVPRVPAAVRCWLWWGVALRFLLGLVAWPAYELPWLPATAAPAAPLILAVPAGAAPAIAALPAASRPRLATVLLALWLAGVALALVFLLRDAVRARRLLGTARRVEPSGLTQLFTELCARFRLRSAALLASPRVASPQVLGLTAPRVVLPEASLGRLSTSELAMAMAHELAHVVRGDLVLGWVPALCRRIFFFHPLAALVAREYAFAREAACDAEVLRVLGSAPQSYGRLLLQWGVVPRETGLAAAAAAPSLRTLKRRLSMLDHATPLSRSRRAAWWLAAGAVVLTGSIPLKLVAQADRSAATRLSPPASPAPVPPPTPAVWAATPAPPPAAPPAPPAPPKPPAVRTGYSYSTGDDGHAWVYLTGDSHTVMSGSIDEYRRVEKLLRQSGEPIFYFRQDGKQYVVRDAALLAEIARLYGPVQKLGEQQGELGAKQGELGSRQGEIGAKQGALGARQGALGAKMGTLASRQAAGDDSAARDAEMEKLAQEMDDLGRQMDQLGEPMEELGRQMEAYGDQMEELGRQMEAASAQADRGVQELIRKALASGLAQEIR